MTVMGDISITHGQEDGQWVSKKVAATYDVVWLYVVSMSI